VLSLLSISRAGSVIVACIILMRVLIILSITQRNKLQRKRNYERKRGQCKGMRRRRNKERWEKKNEKWAKEKYN